MTREKLRNIWAKDVTGEIGMDVMTISTFGNPRTVGNVDKMRVSECPHRSQHRFFCYYPDTPIWNRQGTPKLPQCPLHGVNLMKRCPYY